MPLTPQQRVQRARIAANTRWSKEDPAGTGLRVQAGLRAKFDREVREHEPGLTDEEYARLSHATWIQALAAGMRAGGATDEAPS